MISTNESFVMVLSKVTCNESWKTKIKHGKKSPACLGYFLMNNNSFYNNPHLNSKTVLMSCGCTIKDQTAEIEKMCTQHEEAYFMS